MRILLGLTAVAAALLGSPAFARFEPPASPQTVRCGEDATGRLESEDGSGVTIKVISSCKQGTRVPGVPGFGWLNSRCDIVRTKFRFDSRPDGSRSYTKTEVKNYKNCCGEPVKDVFRVVQLCR